MKNNKDFLKDMDHIFQKHFNHKYVNEEKFLTTLPDKIMLEIPISKDWLKSIFKHTGEEYINLDQFMSAYFDTFKLEDLKELDQFKELLSRISTCNN